MEREVHAILGPLGVKETLSRLVAEDLRAVEDESYDPAENREVSPSAGEGVDRPLLSKSEDQPSEKKKWFWNWRKRQGGEEEGGLRGDANDEMGLTAFLLKFGEGLGTSQCLMGAVTDATEEVPRSRLYISALTIGLSYFVGGLIPLVPYMLDTDAETGLIISCIVTGIVLFVFGGFKTYFTGATGGIGGYLYGATSTMVVGGVAAAAAFGLVKALGVKE